MVNARVHSDVRGINLLFNGAGRLGVVEAEDGFAVVDGAFAAVPLVKGLAAVVLVAATVDFGAGAALGGAADLVTAEAGLVAGRAVGVGFGLTSPFVAAAKLREKYIT